MKYNFSHWGDSLPKVSCQCLTYGRPGVLQEAIKSFLLQDYPGEKELIVLNDHPTIITLPGNSIKDNEEIKFINLKDRVPTVGEKRNICCENCTGDIICVWDDDDISLPWRISVTVENMTNHHHFKPAKFIKYRRTNIYAIGTTSIGHNMCGMSKELWNRIKYDNMQSGQDQIIEKKIKATGLQNKQNINRSQLYYIYRWFGTGSYHLSAKGWNKGYKYCEDRVKRSKEPEGNVLIEPAWKVNYINQFSTFLKKPAINKLNKKKATKILTKRRAIRIGKRVVVR